MATIYYKATKPDGTDFRTGSVDYASAIGGARLKVTTKVRARYECCTADVLHAADTPTETLIGGRWPCRLFEVTGRPVAQEGHKYGFRSLSVVREIDAHLALGPQGRHIVELIERASQITAGEARALDAAWGAAWGAALDAAWDAAWGAAWDAARDAAWGAAWGAAWDATWGAARDATWGAAWGAGGLLVRDLVGTALTQGQYDLLTGPWREVIGPLHPDDAPLASKVGV